MSPAAPEGAAASPRQDSNRAATIVVLNRRLLLAYSQRTSRALAQAVPLRIAVPHIEAVLTFNVGKEIEKDALVIREAALLSGASGAASSEALRSLLQKAREIDNAFLGRVGKLPVGIVIPYDQIEPVRHRRIERVYTAVQRVMAASASGSLRGALQAAYSRVELEKLLFEWLRLYALETQCLSRAVRLPSLLVPLRERIAESLFRIMQDAGARLAHAAAGIVYRK